MPLLPSIPSGGVTLKLTQKEAEREAIGKALSLAGTLVGVAGTLIALSVNPAIKDATSGAFNKLPQKVKDNSTLLIGIMALGGAYLAYNWISKGVEKQSLGRYR